MTRRAAPSGSLLARGVVAGVGGTAIMTAFQKLVEMPLTGREESYAPANFAEKITPLSPGTAAGRRRLNWTTHFALGGMWGAAYAMAAAQGLRGQRAANLVFAVVYSGDVALNVALGLYRPRQWSTKDLLVDIVDKYVQAQGTGVIFDRLLGPDS